MRFAVTSSGSGSGPRSVRPGGTAFDAPIWLWCDPDRHEDGKLTIETADEALAALRGTALAHHRHRRDGRLAPEWLATFAAIADAKFHGTPEKIDDARKVFRNLAEASGALVKVHAVREPMQRRPDRPETPDPTSAQHASVRVADCVSAPTIPPSAPVPARRSQGTAMTRKYRVRTNGEEFWAARDEVLLDAALRHGVDIPHDCRSGQCGKCRVRLVAGDVVVRGDLVAAGARDGVQACEARASSDVTISSDALPEVISTSAQVTAIRSVSPDVLEVLVAPSQPVTILPGQYLNVEFDGYPVRAFSPTLCLDDPSRADALHFHVRRAPGGRVSGALGAGIAPGHHAKLIGPFGSAHLQPGVTSRLVLVADDVGFAPIWSIVAVALQEQPHREIVLVVGSRADHVYIQPALRWLAAYPNVTVRVVDSEFTSAQSFGEHLAGQVPPLRPDDVIHVAGPAPTVDAVMRSAQEAGATCYPDAFEPS